MYPDAEKELVKLFELVESGELPKTAIPRMFYFGHVLVCTYYERNRKYRCLKCKKDFEVFDNGDIYLVALKDIAGCMSGDNGQEITIDYRESMQHRKNMEVSV